MPKILFTIFLSWFFPIGIFGQVCIEKATSSRPLKKEGESNLTISGLRIRNEKGSCIRLKNCHNVLIENSVFGPSDDEAIILEGCTNVTIRNCIFRDNKNGVYANRSSGIRVISNQFSNVQYRDRRGQFIQFNRVYGAGNEISGNVGENIRGNSNAEDLVNLFHSFGTAESPIIIRNNRFRGGGPGHWPDGHSSGGIMTGDGGGGYVRVEDNILVDPGQYGIAIASGNHISILRNTIYAQQQYLNNVGIYVWNQYPEHRCHSHQVEDNTVYYINRNGTPNPSWNAGDCDSIGGWQQNRFLFASDSAINASILPERLLCPELLAWFRPEEKGTDITGNGLHMSTKSSGVQYIDTLGSTFLHLNEKSFLGLPRSSLLRPSLQKISISFWIYPETLRGLQGLVRGPDGNGWTHGWRMILNEGYFSPRIITKHGSAELYCDGLEEGKWNLVTMTYDGRKLKGYVNGLLRGWENIGGDILYEDKSKLQMRIGFANGDYYFQGMGGDMRFYAGELNAAEIATAFDAGPAPMKK